VLSFLDIFGAWDATLAFVMAGAVAVAAIGFALARRRSAPVLASHFSWPARSDIDASLVIGSALFGIGWGLCGICPGPALVNLAGLSAPILVFVAAMVVGMFGYELWQRRNARSLRFLRRFQPGVFGLDQLVKDVLVEHAGFAEGRSRERVDDRIVNFEAAFRVLDHAPFDQLLVADDFREALEPKAETQILSGIWKFALHREHGAQARGFVRRCRAFRAGVRLAGNERRLVNTERLMQPRGLDRVNLFLGRSTHLILPSRPIVSP